MYNEYKVNAYRLGLERDLKTCQELTADDSPDAPPTDVCDPIAFDLAALKFGYLDDTHVIMTSKTHLNFLADWIDLRSAVYSIGDALLELGEYGFGFMFPLFVFDVVRKLRKA